MPYRVDNIVRKGEIACYKQFLLFSLFSTAIYLYCVKMQHCVVMGSLLRQNAALCNNGLTLYYTIPTFNNPGKEAF